jgi:hypothetical protein
MTDHSSFLLPSSIILGGVVMFIAGQKHLLSNPLETSGIEDVLTAKS